MSFIADTHVFIFLKSSLKKKINKFNIIFLRSSIILPKKNILPYHKLIPLDQYKWVYKFNIFIQNK